jgi:hypothetical protein
MGRHSQNWRALIGSVLFLSLLDIYISINGDPHFVMNRKGGTFLLNLNDFLLPRASSFCTYFCICLLEPPGARRQHVRLLCVPGARLYIPIFDDCFVVKWYFLCNWGPIIRCHTYPNWTVLQLNQIIACRSSSFLSLLLLLLLLSLDLSLRPLLSLLKKGRKGK